MMDCSTVHSVCRSEWVLCTVGNPELSRIPGRCTACTECTAILPDIGRAHTRIYASTICCASCVFTPY